MLGGIARIDIRVMAVYWPNIEYILAKGSVSQIEATPEPNHASGSRAKYVNVRIGKSLCMKWLNCFDRFQNCSHVRWGAKGISVTAPEYRDSHRSSHLMNFRRFLAFTPILLRSQSPHRMG